MFLTASAQLHLEAMTTNLGRVYTLSPTFRAEKSLTRHHLAEFYMLEAELIDMNELETLLRFVEDLLKTVSRSVYSKFNALSHLDVEHAEKTGRLLEKKFIRVTYQEATRLLQETCEKKPDLLSKKARLEHDHDLNKEQEKLLAEMLDAPVFVTHFPKRLKPFYMRQSEASADLVDNFDLLVPGVGEIVGGSLREHRVDLLVENLKRSGLDVKDFELYLETKKFGSMKMGG